MSKYSQKVEAQWRERRRSNTINKCENETEEEIIRRKRIKQEKKLVNRIINRMNDEDKIEKRNRKKENKTKKKLRDKFQEALRTGNPEEIENARSAIYWNEAYKQLQTQEPKYNHITERIGGDYNDR